VGMYFGAAALLCGLCHWQYETFVIPNTSQISIILLMGLTTQGFAYLMWDYGSKRGNYKLLCMLSYGNPLIAFIVLALLNFSQPSVALFIATAMIVLAGLLSDVSWRKISSGSS
jgi:drug/metabolite transporter (DMT)-like permease